MALLKAVLLLVSLMRLHLQDVSAFSLKQALKYSGNTGCATKIRRDCSNSFGDEKVCLSSILLLMIH